MNYDEKARAYYLKQHGHDYDRISEADEDALSALLAEVAAEATRGAVTKASADVLNETFAAGKAAGVSEEREACAMVAHEAAKAHDRPINEVLDDVAYDIRFRKRGTP